MRDLLNIDIHKEKAISGKICIIAVIEKEMLAVVEKYKLKFKNGSDGLKWTGNATINDEEYIIDGYQMPNQGNIESALYINNMLQRDDYKFFFIVGTAGSHDLPLYSVMLVSKAVYNGKGAHSDGETEYDTDIRNVKDDVINVYKAFEVCLDRMPEKAFDMKVGTIYSSNYVEKDPQNKEYKSACDAVRSIKAIEMEAYGAFRAEEVYSAMNKRVDKHVVMLRGISDKADGDKSSIYEDGLKPDERKVKATSNALQVLEEYCKFISETYK